MHPTPQEEIELKWALSAAGHARLAVELPACLGAGRRLTQENRFYDSADRRLRAARMNLRLRHENGRILMTVKHKRADGGLQAGLARHDEWEAWLAGEAPVQPSAANLPLPAPARMALGDAPLEALGGFANLRLEFSTERAGIHELLCLDRTDYGSQIDYELEIETAEPPATAAYWSAMLATWGVTWQPQALTKFARYLALSGTR